MKVKDFVANHWNPALNQLQDDMGEEMWNKFSVMTEPVCSLKLGAFDANNQIHYIDTMLVVLFQGIKSDVDVSRPDIAYILPDIPQYQWWKDTVMLGVTREQKLYDLKNQVDPFSDFIRLLYDLDELLINSPGILSDCSMDIDRVEHSFLINSNGDPHLTVALIPSLQPFDIKNL